MAMKKKFLSQSLCTCINFAKVFMKLHMYIEYHQGIPVQDGENSTAICLSLHLCPI